MEISKHSWHYKLLDFLSMSAPQTLCRYFWKVIFALLWFIGGGVCLLFVGWTFGYMMSHAVISLVFFFMGETGGANPLLAGIGGGLWLIVFYIFVSQYINAKGIEIPRPLSRARESVGNSLLGQYLSAAHKKVCPFLDFVD